MVVINQHKSIFQMRSWMSTLWVQSLAVCLWRSDTSEEAVPQAEALHLRLFFLLPSPLFSLCRLWERPVCLHNNLPADPPSCSLCPALLPLCAPPEPSLSVCPSRGASLHHSASTSESAAPASCPPPAHSSMHDFLTGWGQRAPEDSLCSVGRQNR